MRSAYFLSTHSILEPFLNSDSNCFLASDSYFPSQMLMLKKKTWKILRVIQKMKSRILHNPTLFESPFLSPRFLFLLLSYDIFPINIEPRRSWYYSLVARARLTSTWCVRKARLLSKTSRFMTMRIWVPIWPLKQIGNDGVCISVLR